MIRDAQSDVSGSWLSQTSQAFVGGSTPYFFNNIDLGATYKDHRMQISTALQGMDGNLLGVGPILIGDKWIIKDAQQEDAGIAFVMDSILPLHISSENKSDIYQPFGIHLCFVYDAQFVSLGRTVVNTESRFGVDTNDSRTTSFYASIGQGLWSHSKKKS